LSKDVLWGLSKSNVFAGLFINKTKQIGGLFLLVSTSGGKLWHFKYRFANRRAPLSPGALHVAASRRIRR